MQAVHRREAAVAVAVITAVTIVRITVSIFMNQITKLATITDKSLILATNAGFLSVIKWRLVCVVTDTFRKEPGHFSVAGGQVTYYKVKELGGNELILGETDFEAGKPLFYRTSGTGSITFSAESAAGVELVTTPATDNFMVGTMSEVIPNAGYFLKNGNIYPITNGGKVKVKSFRAYVKGQNDASQASVMSVNVARP